MKDFSEMLDRYMALRGIKNDSQLAERMNVSRQYVHRIRRFGKASDSLCIEIGEEIGLHPAAVMVARNAALESGKKGAIWGDFWEKVKEFSAVGNNVAAISEFSGKILENQAVTAIKDYRKYLIVVCNQWVTAFCPS